jgi:hypothetical protein
VKLLTGAVALTTALTFALAPAAAADAPDGKGVPHSTETKSTGKPINPRGFGSITSQRARDDHDIGSHASSQSRPHLGVGNVSRNDQAVFDAAGKQDGNTGTRPGDHAGAVGPLVGYDPNNRPGTHEDESTATTSTDTSAPTALATPAAEESTNTSAPTALATPAADESTNTSAPTALATPAADESTNTSAPTTLATPAANDPSFSLGPLGTFSFSNSGLSLTDYSYSLGLSGGPVEYSVRSQGTPAGVTGFSSFSAGGFSTSTDSQYGTSYEGSSCVLCQENTTGFGDFLQFTEFNVLADGTVEYEGSGPLGNYSWPPE